jgi:hypothetical protein
MSYSSFQKCVPIVRAPPAKEKTCADLSAINELARETLRGQLDAQLQRGPRMENVQADIPVSSHIHKPPRKSLEHPAFPQDFSLVVTAGFNLTCL